MTSDRRSILSLGARFCVPTEAKSFSGREILWTNEELLAEVGGLRAISGFNPVALAYGGHQFGHFVPVLGDGRALLIGETESWEFHQKGVGRTPFSRRGDGLYALGPAIREALMGECMNGLKVPSSRALQLMKTGESVQRDELTPGALLTRVARSHVRIGTFEFAYTQGGLSDLKNLADHCIARLYPEVRQGADPYLELFNGIGGRLVGLVWEWMRVGFIHGVMNTDNCAVSGETLDFGPCAFMDEFSEDRSFSSIDEAGRYRYGNQPRIMLWNLGILAKTFEPLLGRGLDAELDAFSSLSKSIGLKTWGNKLGILDPQASDGPLIASWINILETQSFDFTLAHQKLASGLTEWVFDRDFTEAWRARLQGQSSEQTLKLLSESNPVYIPRNHQVEQAIKNALGGDFSHFFDLMQVMKEPYRLQKGMESFASPPEGGSSHYRTFCGT